MKVRQIRRITNHITMWNALFVRTGIAPGIGIVRKPPMHQAPVWTVARKKDGEIVGMFDSLEEAETVVAKAKSQKKAALEIVPQ